MRRYRFSWKFALVLGGVLVAAGVGLYALHRIQGGRNAQALKTASERAEEAGDLDRSARLLQRYLAAHPADADAQFRFAEMIERRAGGGPARFQAIPAYQQVVTGAPGRTDARQRLAALLTEAGKWNDALPHLKALAEVTPTDPAAHAAVGRAYAAQGDWANAEKGYTAAVKLPTADPESMARLAECRWRMQLPDDAVKTIDGMVTRFPNDARAYLFRAGFRAAHSLPGADDDVAAAKRLDPDRAEVMLAVADAASVAGKPAEARKELTAGLARHPKDARFYLSLARLDLAEGRVTEAVGLLRRGVGELPTHNELLVELVHQLLDTGAAEEARKTFTAARANPKVKWSAVEADLLRGRLAVAAGDWIEAAKVFGDLKTRVPRDGPQAAMIDRLLSRKARREGDRQQQIDLLGSSVKAAPTREVRMEYALALAEAGRFQEAVDQFRELADADPPVAAACVMLARLLLVTSPPRDATAAAWAEVEGLLDRALKAEPKSLAALLTRADVLVARGRRDEAIKLLAAACQDAAAGPAPWVARASLEARAGRPDDARKLLDDAGKRYGEPIDVRVARMLLALEYPAAQAVEEIGRVTAALAGVPADQAAPVWSLAAQAYLRLERFPLAEEAANKLVSLTPDDLQAQLLRFQTAIRSGDDAAAGAAVAAVRRIEGPNGGIASYCEAYRLVVKQTPGKAEKATLDVARGHLAEAAARRRQWPKVPLLRAQVEILEGNPEGAVQSYREAFDAGERSFDVVRALIAHYAGKKQYPEAYDLIRRMQDAGTVPLAEQRLFTAVYLQAADYSRAVEAAKQAVTGESDDPADHLWLALVYATAKKVPEADAELAKACALSKTPEPWVARVQFLASTDRRKEAEALTEELPKKLPKERVALTVAACNEALGRRDLADKSFQEALAAAPTDPAMLQAMAAYYVRTNRFRLAEPLLRRLLTPELKLPAGEAVEVRRTLALGLAERGGTQACAEAAELLNRNVKESGKEDRADALARAYVLARRPGGKREAITLYERLAPAGLPTAARYVFAQLHLVTGDTSKAREQMLLVLGEAGDNPEYVGYWADALIDLGNLDDAQFWVAKLAKVAPNRWPTVLLQARLLAARGQRKEAAARLARFTPADEPEAVSAALWLEEFGDLAGAAKAWAALTDGKVPVPNVGLKYAEYLGRQGKLSDALGWCERYKDRLPAPVLASYAVDILGYGRPADLYRRVDGWLAAVPDKGPDAFPAKFYRAMLLDRQGKHPDAVVALKALVAEQPNNPAVLGEYGRLLTLTGSHGEAEKVLSRAIQLDGPRADLVEGLALARFKANGSADVVRDLAAALTSEPTASGYMLLARMCQSRGDKKAAEQNVREARRRKYKIESAHPLEVEEVRLLLAAYP